MSESQTKTQLQQLSEFLLSSLSPVITASNIDAWQEGGKLLLSGEDKGQGGYQVAKWRYTAVIALENFPHRKVNPYNLLGMIAAFLLDADWQRDEYGLQDPQLDIDIISNDNASIQIELELMDDIDLLPDEQGPVLFNGARYRVSLVPIDYAETVDFHNGEVEQ